jgi:hypothetical protein
LRFIPLADFFSVSLGQAAKSDSACTAMTPAPIDLTPLQRALDALAGALAYWQAEPGDSGRKPHLRAGVIQSFEPRFVIRARDDGEPSFEQICARATSP